ncbi:MAG TPA: hypothetical protein VHE58_08845 [Burkholderiales bacterium]|nr:hypothetical protein [Burkholderiales bacterium]
MRPRNENISIFAPSADQPECGRGLPAVYEKHVKADLDGTYASVSKALEDSNFFVVFEVDIGKNVANFAKK